MSAIAVTMTVSLAEVALDLRVPLLVQSVDNFSDQNLSYQ